MFFDTVKDALIFVVAFDLTSMIVLHPLRRPKNDEGHYLNIRKKTNE